MKKILALLLALAMMLTMLVACKGNEDPSDQPTKKPSSKPSQGEDEFDITEILPESINYGNKEAKLCIRGDTKNEWEIG